MVVVSQQPVLQPLSALANQNAAIAQNNTANSVNPSSTTVANAANTNKGFFDNLISKFKEKNTSAQQANAPVANQVNYLTQQLTNQINQSSSTTNANGLVNDSNLTTTVSINNLNANLAKWQDYLEGNNYSFTLIENNANQNNAAINVNVTNGQVTSASYANGTAVDAATLSSIPTIEQLFSDVQQAYADGERVDALYNPTKGFPQFVFFENSNSTRADDVRFILNNVSVNA